MERDGEKSARPQCFYRKWDEHRVSEAREGARISAIRLSLSVRSLSPSGGPNVSSSRPPCCLDSHRDGGDGRGRLPFAI